MGWPKATEYHEAVQNLGSCADDQELCGGQPALDPLGLPLIWSGNFADVYKIECPATGNTWALKCFTREVPALRDRYRSIAAHLEQAQLPFTVDFQYLERGIRAGGQWCPALKMRWVEGLSLNQFVEEYLDRAKALKQLLELWVKLAARLREAGVAHADLQHGNVILVPRARGQLALRLIDYDGMFVPELADSRSGELGHPAYQHPQRLREGTYNAEVDRFSHLAIYCAIRCLRVGRRDLWRRFNNDDNLLFRESDFQSPGRSDVFRALWGLRDANTRPLVGRLILACQAPLEQVPLLDDLVANGKVLPLTRQEESSVEALLSPVEKPAAVPPVPSESAEAVVEKDRPWWHSRPAPVGDVQPAPVAPAVGETLPTAPRAPLRELWRVLTELPRRALTMLRWVTRPLLVGLRWFDRRLAAIAGEDNTILHGFLRIVVGVAVVLLLTLGATIALPLLVSRNALLVETPGSLSTLPDTAPRILYPLRLVPIPPQIVELGSELTLAVSVDNSDGWQGSLGYALGAQAPSGAKIDPGTGVFTWTPTESQRPGQYDVTVSVQAPEGRTGQSTFTITVAQRIPSREKALTLDLGGGVTMELVGIPAGSFLMGSLDSDRNAQDDEKPQHRVLITEPFYLGKYEVTQDCTF